MKQVLIIYNSKTGTTRNFANNMAQFISKDGNQVAIQSIDEPLITNPDDFDLILLGCWTSGLILFAQHPEKKWIDYVAKLPGLQKKKVGLFTTYKVATGSMFRKMESKLNGKLSSVSIKLKSKNGKLSKKQKEVLSSIL